MMCLRQQTTSFRSQVPKNNIIVDEVATVATTYTRFPSSNRFRMVPLRPLLLLLGSLSPSLSFTPPHNALLHKPRSSSTSLSSSTSSSSSSSSSVDCLVIGGGISGSTLAHNLHNSNLNVLLAESRDYLGGNVQSVTHTDDDGTFIFERGPNSFATQPSIVRISHELGIEHELVLADESLPPWVNHNGKLHPLPKGKGGKGPAGQIELVFGSNGVLKFGLAGDLLSWPGKIRAGIGALLGHAPPPSGKEETIREWVTRILGEEVFLRIIDPFVSGVYAGDPTTLSMKAALPKIARIEEISYDIPWNTFGAIFYGGLARQVELTKERKADPPDADWVEFEYGNPGSYKNGLSILPNAIREELKDRVKLEWKLKSVVKKDGGGEEGYVTTFDTPNGEITVHSKTVVSTIPTHAMGSSFESVLPGSTALFTKERKKIQRKGYITLPWQPLNPRSEGVRTLGTLWSSSLFPGRCPDKYNILLNYIGGSRDPAIGTMKEEDIIAAVDQDLRKVLLQPNAPPPKVLGIQVWPTAIPQYELGHLEMMKELEEMEAKVEGGGLWICGNYRSGVAFPDCVTFGYEHAKVVKEYLEKKP
ncbi:hypothetical protein HJC23_013543 [Cyclotella cryptica]|uniref:Protoporphyrinogen oxidase n=1 Tax=Cyclotella cryptica TaxID=29204 RepID=A0ABD3P4N8_9STRA